MQLTDEQYYRICRIVVGRYITQAEADTFDRAIVLEAYIALLQTESFMAFYLTASSYRLRLHEDFQSLLALSPYY